MNMQTVKLDDIAAQLKGISGSLTERNKRRNRLDDIDQSLAFDFTSNANLKDEADPINEFFHENFTQSLKKLEKAQNKQSNAKKKPVVKSLHTSRTFEDQNMSSIEKEVELIMLNKEQLNLTPAKSVE